MTTAAFDAAIDRATTDSMVRRGDGSVLRRWADFLLYFADRLPSRPISPRIVVRQRPDE